MITTHFNFTLKTVFAYRNFVFKKAMKFEKIFFADFAYGVEN